MQDELIQFERNYVWKLVPKPTRAKIIDTKWNLKLKLMSMGQSQEIKLA